MVSARQEQQLTCWPDHITSIRVNGSFDDCQRLAKQALNDEVLCDQLSLTSANSISIGRLLPQMSYYAISSLEAHRVHGGLSHYVIPTGNLGNALAAIWLRTLGFPIGRIVLATNANRTIPDYLDDGVWSPGETVATLASAMDVGNPSNMERLNHLMPEHQTLRDSISAHAVDDQDIAAQIRSDYQQHGRIWCPHSASAAVVYRKLQTDPSEHWILVATAHAAKFNDIVEPLIGTTITLPESLAAILARPSRVRDMAPDWPAFRSILNGLRAP
jgi:threonine synthase